MSNWINFSILWMLTGSPVAAALILLAAYAVADWYTFGFLRGIAKAVNDFRRGRRLRVVLLHNPHDRKAREDLGEILISQRRWKGAIEVVKPIADEDPHHLPALYMLGIACFATGRAEQGELFLGEVHGADATFKDGVAILELGRWRLRRKDPRAVSALQEYVKAHPHNVEARWLLSEAYRICGDTANCADERRRCWKEYETELPYQQRRDRIWAWRAKPSRPAIYAALACGAIVLFSAALQRTSVPRRVAADVRAANSSR